MAKKKVVVTCAVTGGIHTPSMSPYLPMNQEQIVQHAVDALDAGAAIVHIHGRLENGHPSSDPAIVGKILKGIKARSNGVISVTTGGMNMSVEDRFRIIDTLRPEMASCNCGTMNFNITSTLKLVSNPPKYDWEIPFIKKSSNDVFKNTYDDIEYCITHMNTAGTCPEYEVFDMGQLATLNYFYKKGLAKKPVVLQFVTGVAGGIPLDARNVLNMIDAAKSYFGDDVTYCMVAGGRRMFRYESMMATLGGNVRVGMEDSLYNAKGELAFSNAEQVSIMVNLLKTMGFEIATSDEAREMMQLKGCESVGF